MAPARDLRTLPEALKAGTGAKPADIMRPAADWREGDDQGFILPYVLVVIVVISLIAVIAARTVGAAQSAVFERQQHRALQDSLDQAEEIVLDVFLRAGTVPSGLDLSGRILDEADLIDSLPSEDDLPDTAIWRADGGARYLSLSGNIHVEARYQDGDALLSVNSGTPAFIARWLSGAQIGSREPGDMAAKLSDFRDEDNFRQYRGGERADYRQLGRPIPTNSSLRTPQELQDILGWEDVDFADRADLLEDLTWFYSFVRPRKSAMPAELGARLGLDDPRLSDVRGEEDFFSDLMADDPLPGPRARFAFTACPEAAGRCLRRLVEIEKTVERQDYPYQRRMITEYSLVLAETVPADAQFLFSEPDLPQR